VIGLDLAEEFVLLGFSFRQCRRAECDSRRLGIEPELDFVEIVAIGGVPDDAHGFRPRHISADREGLLLGQEVLGQRLGTNQGTRQPQPRPSPQPDAFHESRSTAFTHSLTQFR
jgi:hypothetical protein